MNMGFIEEFEKKVKDTIEKYHLLSKEDKVIVACSGGKDSTTTIYLLKKFGYNVEGMIIDLLMGEWSKKNLENIKKFCKENGIKLHVINMRKEFGCSMCYIRMSLQSKTKLSNCGICGVIKRWLLNRKARELGATKIATGHNLDDEAETVLMNIFAGNPELCIGFGPKTGITNDGKFVQRIKPLYFCTNEEVRKYSKIMNFPVLYEPCPCSLGSFRREIRKWLTEMESYDPEVKINIVKNFLKLLPILRRNRKKGELKHCKVCSEPSRNDICKTCELIKTLRS
jgi:uncharacterized protein (TIGR00269 family)